MDDRLKEIRDRIEKLPPEQRAEQLEPLLLEHFPPFVREMPVSVEGFKCFYWLTTRRFLPYIHVQVVEQLVEVYYSHSGVMVQAWRGIGKSTLLPVWGSYLIGKNPVGSTCIVRINEGAAKETAKAMESIIRENLGFKACFPNVVPDEDKGWSATDGYFIWDNTIPHAEWMQKCYANHTSEPSLVCGGITSGIIIGKHPTNGMYFDDLHDELNTRSSREMKEVVDVIKGNIVPTWESVGGSPTVAVMCTPWADTDGYNEMLKTGFFKLVKIPIFIRDDEKGELFEPYGYKVLPAWPELFPLSRIEKLYKRDPVQFPRMYLVNLDMMKGTVLKGEWLHEYDATKINPTWPVYFGVDFASTEDKVKDDKHDFFALSVSVAIPGGGMIVVDGFRGQISTGEGLDKIKAFASMYPTLVTIGVEKWGKGEEFKNILLYQTNLPIVPVPYEGQSVKSKGQRYQEELAPMFLGSRLWISDLWPSNDFLKEFRNEWISWDGNKTLTGHDDCLDGVYWSAYVGIYHLMPGETSARPGEGLTPEKRERSPFAMMRG